MRRARGFVDLAFDLVEETTNLIQRTHDTVLARWAGRFAAIEPAKRTVERVTGVQAALSAGVFESIRVVNGMTRFSVNAVADIAGAYLVLRDLDTRLEIALSTLETRRASLDLLSARAEGGLVPTVDVDGNDVAGIRAPMVQAPLGTYTGWNLRSRGHGHGAMYMFDGSYIPFADTPQERAMTGDPRPSNAERYDDADKYIRAIEKAARALVEERLMLEEDVQRCIAAASNWGRPLHDVRL